MYHESKKEILIGVSVAVIIPLVSIVTLLVEWRAVIHHLFRISSPTLMRTVACPDCHCVQLHMFSELWMIFLSWIYFLVGYWIISLTLCVRDLTDLCKLRSGLDGSCCLPGSAFPFFLRKSGVWLKYLSQVCPYVLCCQFWLAPWQTSFGRMKFIWYWSLFSVSLFFCNFR